MPPDATRTFDVAVIGYGLAGSAFHAPVIDATSGLRVAAIVTRDAERAARASAAYPHARILASPEALWDSAGRFGLVVIATPNRTHVPLARAALDAGLPVVVDKPVAASAADAHVLAEHATRRGLMISAYHNRRWDGDFLTLRRVLAEGTLGDVHRFESRFERWRPEPKPGWRRSSSREDAGGLLYDLGPHLIDQALVLFGAVSTVYAEMDSRYGGSDVDDDSFVSLVHTSGVRSHLWMSTLAPAAGPRFRVLGSRAGLVRYGSDPQEAALRAGSRPGAAGWGEDPPDSWTEIGAAGDVRRVPTERGDYGRFYAAVTDSLRTGAPPPVPIADAVAGLEVIEASRQSAAERRVVLLQRLA